MKKPLVISNNGLIEERTRKDSLLVPFVFFDHFVGNLNNVYSTATTGGGGPAILSNTECDQGQLGVVVLRTGTAGTGGALIHLGANAYRTSNTFGLRFIFAASFPVLSNGTNRFVARIGFQTSPQTFGDGTGFYLRYTDNVNGGRVQGVIRKGATETTIDLGVPPTAGLPFNVGFEISVDYTSITFFSIENSGAYVPLGSALLSGGSLPSVNTLMGPFVSIQKAVGGSRVECWLDFIHCEVY